MKQIFTINKPHIMKKSKYRQYFHCFIVYILVPYACWFNFQKNIVTILISAVIGSLALISMWICRGAALQRAVLI